MVKVVREWKEGRSEGVERRTEKVRERRMERVEMEKQGE